MRWTVQRASSGHLATAATAPRSAAGITDVTTGDRQISAGRSAHGCRRNANQTLHPVAVTRRAMDRFVGPSHQHFLGSSAIVTFVFVDWHNRCFLRSMRNQRG